MTNRETYRAVAPNLLVVLGVLGAVLAATLLGGCGNRDNYIVGVADIQATEMVEQGHLETFTLPAATRAWRAASAWPDGELLVANSNSAVFRIRDDLFTDTGWPKDESIMGLVCLPDGTAWGIDSWGIVCFYDGETWTVDTNLEGLYYRGLLLDHEDRLVAYGDEARVYRREATGWQAIELDSDAHFFAAWASADEGLFLADSQLVLFHEVDGVWSRTEPFSEYENPYSYDIFLSGDDGGHLVFGIRGRTGFWIRDGETWTYHQPSSGDSWQGIYSDLFWWNGVLHACTVYSSTMDQWDGEQWQPHVDTPGDIFEVDYSLAAGTDRLLMSDNGLISRYDGTAWTIEHAPFGIVSGVADVQGQIHVVFRRGVHLVREGEGWRRIGRPTDYTYSSSINNSLVPCGEDRLIIVGNKELLLWSPTGSEPIVSMTSTFDLVEPQPNGDLVVVYDRTYGRVVDGHLTWEGPLPTNWSGPRGMVGGDGRYWLQQGRRVGRLVEGTVETHLVTSHGWMRGLLPVQDGVVIYGYERLLHLDETGYRDLTPYLGTYEPSRAARFDHMCLDSNGCWVGWDRNSLEIFRYDGEQWWRIVTDNFLDFGLLDTQTRVSAGESGDVWFWDEYDVVRFNAERAP